MRIENVYNGKKGKPESATFLNESNMRNKASDECQTQNQKNADIKSIEICNKLSCSGIISKAFFLKKMSYLIKQVNSSENDRFLWKYIYSLPPRLSGIQCTKKNTPISLLEKNYLHFMNFMNLKCFKPKSFKSFKARIVLWCLMRTVTFILKIPGRCDGDRNQLSIEISSILGICSTYPLTLINSIFSMVK